MFNERKCRLETLTTAIKMHTSGDQFKYGGPSFKRKQKKIENYFSKFKGHMWRRFTFASTLGMVRKSYSV